MKAGYDGVVPTDIPAFKEAVLLLARQTFPDVQWEDGRLDAAGPSERTIGCVWSGEMHERENVLEVDLVCWLRLYRQASQSTDPYTPISTDDLERDLQRLTEALDADQSLGGSVWFVRPTDAIIDPLTHGMEVTMRAVASNPFEVV